MTERTITVEASVDVDSMVVDTLFEELCSLVQDRYDLMCEVDYDAEEEQKLRYKVTCLSVSICHFNPSYESNIRSVIHGGPTVV